MLCSLVGAWLRSVLPFEHCAMTLLLDGTYDAERFTGVVRTASSQVLPIACGIIHEVKR